MTKGLDDILKNLDKLQVKNRKVAREAVTEVSELFKEKLELNTPIDFNEDGEHLKENINISGFKGENAGIISKDIGFGKETGWRAHFPNDGTIYQSGQDFKEKTINEVTPLAKKIYAEKVRKGLNL